MTVETDVAFVSALGKLHSLYSSLWDINKQLEEHEDLRQDPGYEYTSLMLEIKNMRDNCVELTSYAIFLNQFFKSIDSWISVDDIKSKVSEITESIQSDYLRCERSKKLENEMFQFLMEAWEQLNEVSSIDEAEREVESKISKCKSLTARLNEIELIFGKKITTQQEADHFLGDQKALIAKLQLDLNLITTASQLSLGSFVPKEVDNIYQFQMERKNEMSKGNTEEENLLKQYEKLNHAKFIANTSECQILQVRYMGKNGTPSHCDVKLVYDVKRSPKKLVDVNFVDCPIDVTDLILEAIALNNFFDVLPELVERLYSM